MLRRIRAGNVSKDEEVARVGMRRPRRDAVPPLRREQRRPADDGGPGARLRDGRRRHSRRRTRSRRVLDHAEKKGDEGLTYKDFVTQLEEDFSERHTFDHFLKQLRPVTTAVALKRTSISGGLDAEVERCRQAYDDVKGAG